MKISSVARINFSIVMLCVAAILCARFTGLFPDERTYKIDARVKSCESLAACVSSCVSDHDLRKVGKQLELFAAQNPDLLSVGLRRHNGDLIVAVGSHGATWGEASQTKRDGCYVVQISNAQTNWGQLEIQFQPLIGGLGFFFSPSLLKLVVFVAALVGLACWLHLSRILSYLDPTRSVPPRVREVLDSFAEGVVVLDNEYRIVLVNGTFCEHVRKSRKELLGTNVWDLPLKVPDSPAEEGNPIATGEVRGLKIDLLNDSGQSEMVFSVNASVVYDDEARPKGVMMAFTDVTPLERNRTALLSTLEDLSKSKQAIASQNDELRYLATRDPLTSCINRRTLFEVFEQHWNAAATENIPLCGLMVDIDFFKSINDNYGHSMGDEVLRQTGALLIRECREDDVVCRYGGEEFAILMPGIEIDDAAQAAERIRVGLSELKFDGFAITASLGISAHSLGAGDPQEMLDQADKCLYVAKRNGRNQVVRFDTVPADLVVDESSISRTAPVETKSDSPAIPYSAVTALLSALTFRDSATGAHSKRVASYAALLAQEVLGPKDVYVIEIAGLMHDIGKVGVPDAVLLKPGSLNEGEWQLMRKHERIGVEIIGSSFKHDGLTEIVKYHQFWFSPTEGLRKQPLWGEDIPLGARILLIADAFDSMTSDSPYRSAMPVTDAISELKAFAGLQFDPRLVEIFVSLAESGSLQIGPANDQPFESDVMLAIGEQVERIIEAADLGDGESFTTLAERLLGTSRKYGIRVVEEAASRAIATTEEDSQIESLAKESFALLAACRTMRNTQSSGSEQPRQAEEILSPSRESIHT